MIRKTIFWIHLICGVATGLVILMMSFTGVILTYERQMLAWQTRDFYSDPPAATQRLSIDSLAAAVALAEPDVSPTSVQLSSDPRAPVVIGAGRSGSRYVDPYTAEVLGEPPTGLNEFFGTVTSWHRWFNASGESRTTWRAVTGISNLVFLFLIASGIYLWLPRVYKWAMFRAHLFFNKHALRGKARDYNWHHVFGFWTSIPLFVVVATAVVFSYPWASNAVYRAFGEEPPGGRGPGPGPGPGPAAAAGPGLAAGPGPGAGAGPAGGAGPVAGSGFIPGGPANGAATASPSPQLSLDALFDRAVTEVDDWKTLTLNLPRPGAATASFSIDQGNGGQPQLRHSLMLDTNTGDVTAWQPWESQSPGRRARSWVRFLHTGEALGIVGQTVAGIVSLTSIIMVWTGLALAWRRLVVPLFRQR